MSNTTTTRSRRSTPSSDIDDIKYRLSHDPAFLKAVNHVANYKCLHAIKSGRLRVIQKPEPPVARYSPRVDIVDDPSSMKIVALFELPGMKNSDIRLDVTNNTLVVYGQRNPPTLDALKRAFPSDIPTRKPSDMEIDTKIEETDSHFVQERLNDMKIDSEKVKLHVQELRYGTFHRVIPMPTGVDASHMRAVFHEGILMVAWPRTVTHSVNPASSTSAAPPIPSQPSASQCKK